MSTESGTFTLVARDGAARRGVLQLPHGAVDTPAFMPVGTAGAVKALAPRDLEELGARIVLANTYHLWLRPGLETIEAAGGLHAFMGWDGGLLTDSGGFQVFSLESRRVVTDEGVRFRSHIDGSEHLFTPEGVVAFGERIGVDVAMALDVCAKLPAQREVLEEAVRRTSEWTRRAATAWSRAHTLLFGIVQGGLDEALRQESAESLVALDLPGYAIGGLSVGETREECRRMARLCANLLPQDRPRYLMGVGTIPDLLAAMDAGVDLFDCVYPTRCGRNGRAITRTGELNIRNATFTNDFRPLDEACGCAVCARFTRAYLAHLFRADEMLGPRLLSHHNLAELLALTAEARAAIEAGEWTAFRERALSGRTSRM